MTDYLKLSDYSNSATRQANPFTDTSQHSSRPTVDTAALPRSGTAEFDDIYNSYGPDSPVKTRFPPNQPENRRFDSSTSNFSTSTRDQIQAMPVLTATSTAAKTGREPLKVSTRSNSTARPKQPRSKSNNELDLIDRLDISGLYGGGGFVRHEGPYAAATGSRSPGGNAPIDAFDPSAFSLAGPSARKSQAPPASRRTPPRVQTSQFPDAPGAGFGAGEGPYGAARPAGKQEPVSMGFPGNVSDAKSAQLMEIYGFREAEAWEDYGTARYDRSAAASRESVVPPGATKEERFARTQSIWDIEATLKSGKPVGSSAPPPPVPVIPQEWTPAETSPASKPKRSKSLAARFRAGRRNPNNPMNTDDSDDGREAGKTNSVPTSPVDTRGKELPLSGSSPRANFVSGSGSDENDVERLGSRTAAIRFDEAGERERAAASGMTRSTSGQNDEERQKKAGGLKRLFSTRRNKN